MAQSFWIEEYRKKAALKDPIAQSGRGSQFQAVEFLYVVKQALELLELRPEHDLLDVGCANGLMDIVLSASCRSILGIEPVSELAALAHKNLDGCLNIEVKNGSLDAIPADDNSFDRVLAFDVLQLVPYDEVRKSFIELRRVTRGTGRILVGTVPDARRRTAYLEPYLEGVRNAAHLSEDQKTIIITRNLNASWYDPAELTEWWNALGGECRVHALHPTDPNSEHRFHLVVSLEK
jgi:2-polyprenyl-3-methyl-5-hydroxy-6-metoxy-1,4-benzoquinol methylase